MSKPIVKFSKEFMDDFNGSYQELLSIKQYIQNNVTGNTMSSDMTSVSFDTNGFSSVIEFNLN
jgi:hypothetical protein